MKLVPYDASSLSLMTADPAGISPERAQAEFEAILLSQALGPRKPLFEDGPLGGGSAGALYRELMVEEAVRQAVHQRGLGLGLGLDLELDVERAEAGDD